MVFFSYSDNLDADWLRDSFQSLNDGLCNILSDIFDCERFAVELLTNYHDDHIRVCLEIMRLLLKSSDIHNPLYLNHVDIESKNIMHHMLNDCIPKGKQIVLVYLVLERDIHSLWVALAKNSIIEMIQMHLSPNLHTDVVNVCTGLWLSSNGNQLLNKSLEKIILEASLSDDIYRLPILLDIWTLYLRYDMRTIMILRLLSNEN